MEYTGIFILYKMRLKVKGEPLVTILIPNKDQAETLDTCVRSIYEKTDYPHFEILIVENNSEKEETFAYYEKMEKEHENFRVVRYEGGFNYSAINNFGAHHAKGDYLLLLNNDTEVISPFWIREMVGFCQREDTGAVGSETLLSGRSGPALWGGGRNRKFCRSCAEFPYPGRMQAISEG
ncbi:MAG: glycosyltransferase [Blautia sp.]